VERRLGAKDGTFGIGEFFIAAMVAALVDEFLGSVTKTPVLAKEKGVLTAQRGSRR
jgi:hypothetical protein